jgi:hypothetical protein
MARSLRPLGLRAGNPGSREFLEKLTFLQAGGLGRYSSKLTFLQAETALLIISALQRTTKMLMGIQPYTSPEPEDAVILYFFSSLVVHLL